MSAKITLCLYGTPRNAMPSLQGRSGKTYARAHFNEKEMRHETQEFDMEEWRTAIFPDIVKFPSTLRWWPIVAVEADSEEVTRLKADLAEALANIATLKTEFAKEQGASGVTILEGANDGEIGSPVPTGAGRPLPDLKHRELRAKAKARGISIANNPTKDELIALLSDPLEPEPAGIIET